jgi:2',3'-cyclic-nucleotide 2'-phosphodiesterase (5'-nucleotidase family)
MPRHIRRTVRTVALLPLLLSVIILTAGGREARAQGFTDITILHDTHLHGLLTGPNDVTLAHFAGLVKKLRGVTPGNSLWLGAGDDLGASQMSSVFKGMQMVDALNAAGLDADTFGNHEFDYGPDNLVAMVKASRFAWVSANVIDRRTGDVFAAEAGAKRYILKDVGGLRVGISGMAWQFLSATNAGPNVEVINAVEAMAAVVPEMRAAGAQIVVVMAHMCGPEAQAVAEAIRGIDAIVGDHCAERLEFPGVAGQNATILSRRGDEYQPLGELALRYEGGSITAFGYQEHPITRDAPEDSAVKAVIDRYKEQLEAQLGEPQGATSVPLDTRTTTVRAMESNIGNYIADAMRAWGKADVAIQNGGGIRGNKVFEPGTLTRGDIFTILPFTNTGTLLRISGEGLRAALENGVSQVPTGGRFPQVSGLTFRFDPEAAPGTRVLSVTVGGEPLDPNRLYTLATNDFMANGGDGYDMFKSAEVLIAGQAGPLLTDLLAAAVQAEKTIAPKVEGRILIGKP